jgi:hypothetical protein
MTVTPPRSFTRFKPIEPFAPVPESTTQAAFAPCASPSVRKKNEMIARARCRRRR